MGKIASLLLFMSELNTVALPSENPLHVFSWLLLCFPMKPLYLQPNIFIPILAYS